MVPLRGASLLLSACTNLGTQFTFSPPLSALRAGCGEGICPLLTLPVGG
jgi:hypothetical protein